MERVFTCILPHLAAHPQGRGSSRMVINICQYPNRLPWLTKEQQERVDKANELYRITCELMTLCQTHKILWLCENPGRSFMWQTTSFVSLFDTIPCESTQLHHCMYGSSRRKLTRLIHNIPSSHQLCQMCDNNHEHEPWWQRPDGSWATSEETAHWPLARAIAAQVVLQLQDQGLVCHLPSFAEQECTLQAMRASTNIQPRKNLPPMVPEFKQVIHQNSQNILPEHSRLLSTPKRGYVASAKESKYNQVTVGVHFASMTCEDLRKASNPSREVLLESVQRSGDKETDSSLFATTLKEVEKVSPRGP